MEAVGLLRHHLGCRCPLSGACRRRRLAAAASAPPPASGRRVAPAPGDGTRARELPARVLGDHAPIQFDGAEACVLEPLYLPRSQLWPLLVVVKRPQVARAALSRASVAPRRHPGDPMETRRAGDAAVFLVFSSTSSRPPCARAASAVLRGWIGGRASHSSSSSSDLGLTRAAAAARGMGYRAPPAVGLKSVMVVRLPTPGLHRLLELPRVHPRKLVALLLVGVVGGRVPRRAYVAALSRTRALRSRRAFPAHWRCGSMPTRATRRRAASRRPAALPPQPLAGRRAGRRPGAASAARVRGAPSSVP